MASLSNTWKDVKGYEGSYLVNAQGEVKSIKFSQEKVLSQTVSSNKYKNVTLRGSKVECRTVHSIVAEAFLGLDRSSRALVVDHVNNNPMDNRVANLQLISQRENCTKDKHRMNKSSKYVGVSKNSKGKFYSHIRFSGVKLALGTYVCEDKAKEVRDLALAIINNPAIEDKFESIDNLKAEYKEPRKKRESKKSKLVAIV